MKFDFRIVKLHHKLFVFGDVVYRLFVHICFIDDCVYNFSIYEILILFREKDLRLSNMCPDVQDPEKSVRVLGIFHCLISYSNNYCLKCGGSK